MTRVGRRGSWWSLPLLGGCALIGAAKDFQKFVRHGLVDDFVEHMAQLNADGLLTQTDLFEIAFVRVGPADTRGGVLRFNHGVSGRRPSLVKSFIETQNAASPIEFLRRCYFMLKLDEAHGTVASLIR